MIKLLLLLLSTTLMPESGKPGSVLYFKTATCGWCVRFERETKPFVSPMYSYYAENNATAVRSYGITGYPAFIVFDKDGSWRRHEGFLDVNGFKAFIKGP